MAIGHKDVEVLQALFCAVVDYFAIYKKRKTRKTIIYPAFKKQYSKE